MKKLFFLFAAVSVFAILFSCKKDEDDLGPPAGIDKVVGTWNGIYNSTTVGTLTITKLSAHRIRLVPGLANHSTTELDVTDTTFTSGGETITEVEGTVGTATIDQVFFARISSKSGASSLQYTYLNPVAAESWQFSSTK
jgi:hypothetical protein